jgi:hypothetical protein
MTPPPPPACDSHGWFQAVLPPPPPTWPWALPHLYAVNVAADPGVLDTCSRFEVIGFWHGEYALLHWEQTPTRSSADEQARSTFRELHVRYLLHSGEVIDENQGVEITGTWPAKWVVKSHQDVGVLCAFVYESAMAHGGRREADAFRSSITRAWPITEQLLVYVSALEMAHVALAPYLGPEVMTVLAEVLKTVRGWLR